MISFKDFQVVNEKYVVRYKRESDRAFNELLVSDDQFIQAFRYLQVSEQRVKTAIAHLSTLGFGEKGAHQVLSIVRSYDNPGAFFKAIENKMDIRTFIQSKDVIATLTTRYGLSRELIMALLEYEPPTKPSTGKGEALVCIFVDGARKGREGDVDINGQIFETKGSGARLMGIAGGAAYGSQLETIKVWTAGLSRLLRAAGITPKEFDLQAPKRSFTILKRPPHGLIDEIAPEIIMRGKATKKDIVKLYADGLTCVYRKANRKILEDWLSRTIDMSGNIIADTFFKEYFLFALQYYATQENFDYLLAIGTDQKTKALFGKMGVVSKREIIQGDVFDKIEPGGLPGFTPGGGAWGPFFVVQPVP
jgi:hypothetical protein